MNLGENIRYLRIKNNYSQEQLAEKLGYKSYTTIQKWESGVSLPPLDKMKAIATLFNCNIDELMNKSFYFTTKGNDNSFYQECNLEKHECSNCGNQFIVGTEMLDGKKPVCPYCGSGSVEKVAWTDSERLQELDLGCLSLMKEIDKSLKKGIFEVGMTYYNKSKQSGSTITTWTGRKAYIPKEIVVLEDMGILHGTENIHTYTVIDDKGYTFILDDEDAKMFAESDNKPLPTVIHTNTSLS